MSSADPTAAWADPDVTLSVYCSGRLDDVIRGGLQPFLHHLEARGGRDGAYLWFLRYARDGEHLKVRLHGPEATREARRQLLDEDLRSFLRGLEAATGASPARLLEPGSPAIDEDEGSGERRDRSLVWTAYRRSHLSFGGGPFLQEGRYLELFTRCLGAGCEMVIEALANDQDAAVSHLARFETHLGLLRGALQGLAFEEERRRSYLLYHRDGLIRHLVSKSPAPAALARTLLDRCDSQLEQLDEEEGRPTAARGGRRWAASVRELFEQAARLGRDSTYRIDPFAEEAAFPPLFKVLHGVANALGLNPLNETLAVHHLIGNARLLPGNREVGFRPREAELAWSGGTPWPTR
jgi:hypothetical protein